MLRKLQCWIFGHRYEVWQHFGHASRRVVCDCCGGDWGMNDRVQAFIPWCGQLAEMYELMGYKIRPRAAQRRSGE